MWNFKYRLKPWENCLLLRREGKMANRDLKEGWNKGERVKAAINRPIYHIHHDHSITGIDIICVLITTNPHVSSIGNWCSHLVECHCLLFTTCPKHKHRQSEIVWNHQSEIILLGWFYSRRKSSEQSDIKLFFQTTIHFVHKCAINMFINRTKIYQVVLPNHYLTCVINMFMNMLIICTCS